MVLPMTKPDKMTDLQKLLVRLMARCTGPREDRASATDAARQAYEDLAGVLIPLVSQSGFEALVTRAFQLTQREYPAAGSLGDGKDGEPFTQIASWLDRQDQSRASEAAAAMFASLAGLLITLIGESLTTRYLQKAWPECFSGKRSKGRQG